MVDMLVVYHYHQHATVQTRADQQASATNCPAQRGIIKPREMRETKIKSNSIHSLVDVAYASISRITHHFAAFPPPPPPALPLLLPLHSIPFHLTAPIAPKLVVPATSPTIVNTHP